MGLDRFFGILSICAGRPPLEAHVGEALILSTQLALSLLCLPLSAAPINFAIS